MSDLDDFLKAELGNGTSQPATTPAKTGAEILGDKLKARSVAAAKFAKAKAQEQWNDPDNQARAAAARDLGVAKFRQATEQAGRFLPLLGRLWRSPFFPVLVGVAVSGWLAVKFYQATPPPSGSLLTAIEGQVPGGANNLPSSMAPVLIGVHDITVPSCRLAWHQKGANPGGHFWNCTVHLQTSTGPQSLTIPMYTGTTPYRDPKVLTFRANPDQHQITLDDDFALTARKTQAQTLKDQHYQSGRWVSDPSTGMDGSFYEQQYADLQQEIADLQAQKVKVSDGFTACAISSCPTIPPLTLAQPTATTRYFTTRKGSALTYLTATPGGQP